MSFVDCLDNIAFGAGTGVFAVVALPVFGPVGAITAAGVVFGSCVGGGCGLLDSLFD